MTQLQIMGKLYALLATGITTEAEAVYLMAGGPSYREAKGGDVQPALSIF